MRESADRVQGGVQVLKENRETGNIYKIMCLGITGGEVYSYGTDAAG